MGALKELDKKEKLLIKQKLQERLNTIPANQHLLRHEKRLVRIFDFNRQKFTSLFTNDLSDSIKFDRDNISQLSSEISESQYNNPVEWINRSTIRVFNFSTEVSDNLYEKDYRTTEKKLKKLQLFESRLINELIQGLFKITAVICSVVFTVLMYFYLKKAKLLHLRINHFFEGLAKWGQGQFDHRETVKDKDELGVIQLYFNGLATEIEKGRKKSIDQEKISHWQTVAKKMAHEVKNPLTPIQLIFSSIKRGYKGDDNAFKAKLEESYNDLQNEVSGLRRLVDSFTEFSSLPVTNIQRQDIYATLGACVKKYRPLAGVHDISLEPREPSEVPWPHDRGLISQVISNLLKNALEACANSPSQIILKLVKTESALEIIVQDNGPGIEPSIQNEVFNPHFSTKNIDDSSNLSADSGMGLGLAICKKIIYDHGGDIAFKSKNHLTVFTITLPGDNISHS